MKIEQSILRAKSALVVVICCLLSVTEVSAQDNNSTVLDGSYSSSPHPDGLFRRNSNIAKQVVPYPDIREADVMYTKRVWQYIDLREKINHPLYFPVSPITSNDWKQLNLWDAIYDATAKKGLFPVYSATSADDRPNDSFNYLLSQEQIKNLFTTKSDSIDYKRDSWTDEHWDWYTKYDGEIHPDIKIDTIVKYSPIKSTDIVGYKIKEDWIWDRQRGQRFVRIVGIAPMVKKTIEGTDKGVVQELCWIYYPEARAALNKYDSYNPLNDAARRTYAEIFEYRYFSSYVVKESNVYDREINSYARGLDAIAESERIKEDLFILEHDLWHY